MRWTIAESHEVDRRGGSFLAPSSRLWRPPPPPKIAAKKERLRATFLWLSSAGSSARTAEAAATGPTCGVRKKRRLGWCAKDDDEVAYAQASERRCAA